MQPAPQFPATIPGQISRVALLGRVTLLCLLMGAGMARALFHIERPKVGLLNVGVEEIKGAEEVKEAHLWLKETAGLPLDYCGYVEGDEIYLGKVDVIVCDGFVGNVALKTSEGLARMISQFMKEEFTRNPFAKMAALVARPVLKALRRRLDPRLYDGASLVGLNGVVVKSHGGTDAVGFEKAIHVAATAVQNRVTQIISQRLSSLQDPVPSTSVNAPP